jgi:hypothetical protein
MDLLQNAVLEVPLQFAEALRTTVAALPDYEYYNLCDDSTRQEEIFQQVYAQCPAEMDQLIADMRERLNRRPYIVWLRGLSLDERAWTLLIVSFALGQLVVPAGKENSDRIYCATEPVVISDRHTLSRLHTDGTNWEKPNDITCLACFQADQSGGGHSIILDVDSILDEVSEQPELLEMIQHVPVPVMISRNNEFIAEYHPILDVDKNLRWFRQGIDYAYDKGKGEIAPHVRTQINQFENLVENSEQRLIFALEPNDILIMNNRKCLHGRTAIKHFSSTARRFMRTRLYFRA